MQPTPDVARLVRDGHTVYTSFGALRPTDQQAIVSYHNAAPKLDHEQYDLVSVSGYYSVDNPAKTEKPAYTTLEQDTPDQTTTAKLGKSAVTVALS